MKQTMTVPSSTPRNPYVKAALFKRAGAHQKSRKALRRADKVKLIKGD